MGRDKIEDDMRKRHDPDLSNEAWDKRWEKARQVKQHAREKDREKLKKKIEEGEIEIDGMEPTPSGSSDIALKRKRDDPKSDGEISDDEAEKANPKDNVTNQPKRIFMNFWLIPLIISSCQ